MWESKEGSRRGSGGDSWELELGKGTKEEGWLQTPLFSIAWEIIESSRAVDTQWDNAKL